MAKSQKEIIEGLVNDVEKLKLDMAALQKTPEVTVDAKPAVPVPVPDYPVPAEYKEIIELTFNKSFGVRLEPMSDTPAFLLSIVIPPKYSKVTSGEDLRPKVITYSDGVQGVRMWAEKVFGNFDVETQNLIVSDRPFVEAQI